MVGCGTPGYDCVVGIGCAFTELRSPPAELHTWERCQMCGRAWDEMPPVCWRFSGHAKVSTAQNTLPQYKVAHAGQHAWLQPPAAASPAVTASNPHQTLGFRV